MRGYYEDAKPPGLMKIMLAVLAFPFVVLAITVAFLFYKTSMILFGEK